MIHVACCVLHVSIIKFKMFDPFTNNCGMYWSDGRIQSSVSNFTTNPVNRLDATCMAHDSAYAQARSVDDLTVADNKFFDDNFLVSPKSTAYAVAVKYGNSTARQAMGIASDYADYLKWFFGFTDAQPGQKPKPTGQTYDPSKPQEKPQDKPDDKTTYQPKIPTIPEGKPIVYGPVVDVTGAPINLQDPPLMYRDVGGNLRSGTPLMRKKNKKRKLSMTSQGRVYAM